MMLKAGKFVSTIENIISTIEKFVLKAGFQIEKRRKRTWPRSFSRAEIARIAPATPGTRFLSWTMSVEAPWRAIEGRPSAPPAR